MQKRPKVKKNTYFKVLTLCYKKITNSCGEIVKLKNKNTNSFQLTIPNHRQRSVFVTNKFVAFEICFLPCGWIILSSFFAFGTSLIKMPCRFNFKNN